LDLSGNVWEWYLNEYDQPRNVTLSGQSRRVVRGGAWYDARADARAAGRYDSAPDNRNNNVGFRLACSSPI
jgi:formylglycine-generating enzyme required for sulfatase activity